jgi:hypothetical protein
VILPAPGSRPTSRPGRDREDLNSLAPFGEVLAQATQTQYAGSTGARRWLAGRASAGGEPYIFLTQYQLGDLFGIAQAIILL